MPAIIEVSLQNAGTLFADGARIHELLDQSVDGGRTLSEAITDQIRELAVANGSAPDVAFSVRVGSSHIKLKKAVWDAAITGTIAVLSAAEPTPLTKGAAAAKVIDYLVKLKSYIQLLSPVEIAVYDLVVTETERLRTSGSVLRSDYPSQDDIERFIRAQGHEVPENMKDILDSLVAKGGLTVVFQKDSATRYRRVI